MIFMICNDFRLHYLSTARGVKIHIQCTLIPGCKCYRCRFLYCDRLVEIFEFLSIRSVPADERLAFKFRSFWLDEFFTVLYILSADCLTICLELIGRYSRIILCDHHIDRKMVSCK